MGKSGSTSSRKKIRKSSLQPVELALETWFTQKHSMNIPISGTLLAEKAKVFASALGFNDFRASNGFIDRFKKRHGIKSHLISGEAAAADINAANAWIDKTLPGLLQRYAPEDIYNADESGLFYEGLPNKTLAYKGEKCFGGKLSKKRVKLLLCTNMSGTDKRKLLFIGRSSKLEMYRIFGLAEYSGE